MVDGATYASSTSMAQADLVGPAPAQPLVRYHTREARCRSQVSMEPCIGIIGYTLGLCIDNGKENGNHYFGLYRDCYRIWEYTALNPNVLKGHPRTGHHSTSHSMTRSNRLCGITISASTLYHSKPYTLNPEA